MSCCRLVFSLVSYQRRHIVHRLVGHQSEQLLLQLLGAWGGSLTYLRSHSGLATAVWSTGPGLEGTHG